MTQQPKTIVGYVVMVEKPGLLGTKVQRFYDFNTKSWGIYPTFVFDYDEARKAQSSAGEKDAKIKVFNMSDVEDEDDF